MKNTFVNSFVSKFYPSRSESLIFALVAWVGLFRRKIEYLDENSETSFYLRYPVRTVEIRFLVPKSSMPP